MPRKQFLDILRSLRFGELHDELTDALGGLAAQCADTGRNGKLSLTLTIKPGKAGQIEIVDEIAVKPPKADKGTTLMFVTPEGHLQREDPRQLQIDGLRTVEAPAGEPRKAGEVR